ncbi:carboxypeptidase-like regulatory domain-containing protein [Thermopirellula anaerolimosa]
MPQLRLLCLLCVVGLLLGCQKGPKTGTVEGVVTMDGQPLANVLVTFTPVEGGMASTGTTDDSGKYSLVYPGGKGAVVGKHKVSVRTLPKAQAAAEVSSDDPSYEAAYSGGAQSPNTTASAEPIPPKYNVQTELEFEVKSGRNTIDLPLTKN